MQAKIKAKPVTIWLSLCLVLMAVMMVMGGVARLKESGYSLLQWKPFASFDISIVPPQSLIEKEFDSYTALPAFKKAFPAMELDEFSSIYQLEHGVYTLDFMVQVGFFIPLIIFAILRFFDARALAGLLMLAVLIILQDYAKSYFLENGWFDNRTLTAYRIACELGLQYSMLGSLLWLILSCSYPQAEPTLGAFELASPRIWLKLFALLTLLLIITEIMLGGAVSGLGVDLKSGVLPKLDAGWIPDGIFPVLPWYKNLFEDAVTAQFLHQLLAGIMGLFIPFFWLLGRNNPHVAHLLPILFSILVVQFLLGILTLLFALPIRIVSLHLATSILLFLVAMVIVHRVFMPIRVIRYA